MFGRRNGQAAYQEQLDNVVDITPTLEPAQAADENCRVWPLNADVAATRMEQAKTAVFDTFVDEIDLTELSKRETVDLHPEIREVIADIISAKGFALSSAEQQAIAEDICNDVLGLGPLEPLLQDDAITEIMVNDANTVFVEREGLITQTDVRFKDNSHLMNVCIRIASSVGRRIDESKPLCDARLPDGSRVNIVIPPLSLKGPTLTIRKFAEKALTIDALVQSASMSPACAKILKAAAASRINILVSGGTGSGKTTLLNALSEFIDNRERLVTIEDTAELQLVQPNVVNLESRQANLEGAGEIT